MEHLAIDLLFQSTLPMKGATLEENRFATITSVSIHAPNEGSDVFFFGPVTRTKMFQSTLPMKGATPDNNG